MYLRYLEPRLAATVEPTLHKDRTGGDLFLFTHLTVEVSVFIHLFIFVISLEAGLAVYADLVCGCGEAATRYTRATTLVRRD